MLKIVEEGRGGSLTIAEAATRSHHVAPGSAFRDENAAQKEGGQFVAFDVDHGTVKFQLVLSVSLPEIAHVIREDGEIIRDLGRWATKNEHTLICCLALLPFN